MVRTTRDTRGKHTITLAEDVVNSTSVAYDRMARRWELPDTLLGGTVAMREAGEKYLPREPREKVKTWQNRLNRSILFNGYEDTLEKLSAKPFQKPVTVENEDRLDERLRGISANADLRGNDISQFAANLFKNALHRGVSHVLVDFPRLDEELTLREEIQRGVRPYFLHVDPIDLPAWRARVLRSGEKMLTQIRLKEIDIAEDGQFGEKLVETIRVLTAPFSEDDGLLEAFVMRRITREQFVAAGGQLGTVRVYRRETENDEDLPENQRRTSNFERERFEEVVEERGVHTYPGIPLKSLYFNRTGFLTAEPPLEDLAWLNLAHWQSYSDQRNILRFARVGILFMTGLSKQEAERELTVGPTQLWRSVNPEAKLTHVEHSGKSIEAGFKDLEELERRMETLGMQPFVQRTGNVTATSRAIDTAKEQSQIKSWVRATGMVLEQCYECASIWVGEDHPEDFKAEIFSDFGIGMKASDDVNQLIELRNPVDPQISHETLINETKRRGLLSDNVDAAEERQRIADEGGGIDRFLRGGPDDDDDDDPSPPNEDPNPEPEEE